MRVRSGDSADASLMLESNQATLFEQASYTSLMQDQKPTALQPASTTSIQIRDGRPVALPAKSLTIDVIAHSTTPEPLPHIGIKGYLRLARVLTSVFLFGLRVIINTRGWRIGKKTPESELRRLEGKLLRERLLKLGPTFI